MDICSTVFDTKRLAWHYRSHYEQLIAFSNLHFYNNQLVTFPSSITDHKWIGVDYYYVDGTFDRRSKTNRTEAEFIVDLIYQNIDAYPERSLGVVAFSVAQQDMIDQLLSKRREADQSSSSFYGILRHGGFLYIQGKTSFILRVPGIKRDVKYIALEELASGFYHLIKQNVTASKEGLYRTMTTLLGFSRTGEAFVSRFDEAIKILLQNGMVKEEADMLSLS